VQDRHAIFLDYLSYLELFQNHPQEFSMTNTVENKEIAAPAAANEPTKTAENPQTENLQDINWKKFRENREKERKEREELERDRAKKAAENEALKAALEALANKPNPQSNDQDRPEETDEQRIRRQVKEAVEEREKAAEEARIKREAQELPQKLHQTYNDFDSVCSNENLDYLEFHYPEIAAPYKHLPDSYEKWANIYKAVKRFVPNPNSSKDQKKAEKNFNKPQSMAVPGSTMTTDTPPTVLDDKRKESNWLRMQRRMKGLSG
jgi:hypothetical protein